jgi:hypothetical protein
MLAGRSERPCAAGGVGACGVTWKKTAGVSAQRRRPRGRVCVVVIDLRRATRAVGAALRSRGRSARFIFAKPPSPGSRRRPIGVLTATQHHAACRCQHGNDAAAAKQRNQLVCCAAAAGGPHAAGSMFRDQAQRPRGNGSHECNGCAAADFVRIGLKSAVALSGDAQKVRRALLA